MAEIDYPLGAVLARLGPQAPVEEVYEEFAHWAAAQGTPLYPHQEEALLATLSGDNTIITTPTGSGKSLIATAAHVATLVRRGRVYYTAPIKALVSEKFFDWCALFGPDVVGMVTGDASVNPDAPIICCTAEILANIALREGRTADVTMVVADEYHFIADPQRGWAWQIATTALPQAQFMLMSATLGDVTHLARALTTSTGRQTTVIDNAARPVPLIFDWSMTPLPELLENLVAARQTPIYLVHTSQGAATAAAQGLMSVPLIDATRRRAIVEAIGTFRFARGFGSTLSKLLRHGIGVHHAGLLPKYRRLVETLAQQGLLVVICGTDTLGVGINVPIRTVIFTTLAKYDGRRERILRSREFHQIAGRAGRPGFDPVGNVVAQAPEHAIENARIAAKHAGNEKKLKSVRKLKPPPGQVNYNEETFTKLVNSTPEPLHGRLRITHAMLLNLLSRDQDTGAALTGIIDAATTDRAYRRRLIRQAVQLARSLIEAGVVVRRPTPTPGGRLYDLAPDLQDDFALNQPLSAFAMSVISALPEDRDDYALDIVSIIEATLEDPLAILLAQQSRVRAELNAELKLEGMDYTERKALVDEATWPQPLAEELEGAQQAYLRTHPWMSAHQITPKSILRDMVERSMSFGEFVAYYGIERSEGLLLRYLTDAWRALRHSVPPSMLTDELDDILSWLGALITYTDSSLMDEWESLTGPYTEESRNRHQQLTPEPVMSSTPRALRVMVRNAMFRRVQLAAADDTDALAALEADVPGALSADDWYDALGRYWDDYPEIGTGANARGPQLFSVDESDPRHWKVRQIIDDPDGNHDWHITATVDLDATDAAGELRMVTTGFSPVAS